MNSEVTELFRQERTRTFAPSDGFCERVMLRLQNKPVQQQTLWEDGIRASWPMLAATPTCLLLLIGVLMTMPVTPNQGLIEIYAESEVPPAQQAIYMDVDPPSTAVVIDQLISEDEQ